MKTKNKKRKSYGIYARATAVTMQLAQEGCFGKHVQNWHLVLIANSIANFGIDERKSARIALLNLINREDDTKAQRLTSKLISPTPK